MSSSADDVNVIDSSTIFIGTTDDEGWAKYGFSDTGSDTATKVARKKKVKVEEKGEDMDKKDPEEQEKAKEDELVRQDDSHGFETCDGFDFFEVFAC